MGQMAAKYKDTQFEAEVLRADPAIKRFRAIKELLWKRGLVGKLHDRKCICIFCIEEPIKRIAKTN